MDAKDIQDWASRTGGGSNVTDAAVSATPTEELEEEEEETPEPIDLRDCAETLREKAKGVRGLTVEGADLAAIADKLDEAATELDEAADLKDDADVEATDEEADDDDDEEQEEDTATV